MVSSLETKQHNVYTYKYTAPTVAHIMTLHAFLLIPYEWISDVYNKWCGVFFICFFETSQPKVQT